MVLGQYNIVDKTSHTHVHLHKCVCTHARTVFHDLGVQMGMTYKGGLSRAMKLTLKKDDGWRRDGQKGLISFLWVNLLPSRY